MKSKEFKRRTKEIEMLLDNYYKDEMEIGYVLLLQAPDEKEGRCHNNLLSNVKPPNIVLVVNSIMRRVGSLIGRQN